jgi:hypothetical protein
LPTVLRNYKGVNVVGSPDHDDHVIAKGYRCILERLQHIICPKRLGFLCQGIFVLHDIAIWTCDNGSNGLPSLQYWSRLLISICLDPLNKHPAGNRYQHEASCRLMATDTWQGFLLCQNIGLGANVSQMLECQWYVCGGWMCVICERCITNTLKSEQRSWHQLIS